MAAGLGFKTFASGDVLSAADVNGYLMQGVLVFASAAARDAAITAPAEGQFAFTKDTNGLWYYDGAAWVASGATGDIEGVTAGTGISGGGTSGTVTITNSMATAIDAKGDLIGGTGADTFSRLAVGANGTVLTADSAETTGLKWATPASGSTFAGTRLVQGSPHQSIPNNTYTSVTFGTETYDTDAYHSTSSNTSRITIPSGKAGYYNLWFQITWDNTNVFTTETSIAKNGSISHTAYYKYWVNSGGYMTVQISDVLYGAVGDYFEFQVYQNIGSAMTIIGGSTYATAAYLGA